MADEIQLTFFAPNIQSILRLVSYGTGSFSLFCMFFPRVALREMRRYPAENENSKAERLLNEICRFFGFMSFWVSVMAHEIIPLPLEFTKTTRRRIGFLLMWDALFVKFFCFHRSGLFKFNHSVGAGVFDFICGLIFLLSSNFPVGGAEAALGGSPGARPPHGAAQRKIVFV